MLGLTCASTWGEVSQAAPEMRRDVNRAEESASLVGAKSVVEEVDRLNGVGRPAPASGSLAVTSGETVAMALVELIPSVPGPYTAESTIDIDVWIQSLDDADRELRYLALDFTDTSPMILLPTAFQFDLEGLGDGGATYFKDVGLPTVVIAYTGLSATPENMVILPANGLLHAGILTGVALPAAAGTYDVDALNADEPQSDHGAELRSGFGVLPEDPLVAWRAYEGEIIGEPLRVDIVSCTSHADCDDGLFCNGAERCDSSGSCRPAALFPCPYGRCDETANRCLPRGGPPPMSRIAPSSSR